MLNAGPSGPPFAPYERPRASKLGRCRIEGIPEVTSPKERSRRERYYGRGIGKAGIAEPHTILTFAPTNPDERIQEACQAQNSNWRP